MNQLDLAGQPSLPGGITDYLVTVCASCLRASCWHGESMCDNATGADLTTRKASELRELGREHPDRFSRQKIWDVFGVEPEVIESRSEETGK